MNFQIYSGLGAEINCNTLVEIEAMFAKYCARFFYKTLAFFISLFSGLHYETRSLLEYKFLKNSSEKPFLSRHVENALHFIETVERKFETRIVKRLLHSWHYELVR